MRRWQSEKKSNMREEQLVGKCNLQKQINQGDSEDCQQTKASNASRLFNFLLPKIKLLQTLQIKGVRKRFNGVMSKSLKVPFLNKTPIHINHHQIPTSVNTDTLHLKLKDINSYLDTDLYHRRRSNFGLQMITE